ncbi:AAA family ATPase [Paenibacillus spiritus]|uniref:AAA family ATPase n=1 Tax=Paenibacillus spiritus TaxID=2496557 RepID=A0A5J5GGN1_9BACL|nr:AAA family ATPase [Paenibacillus spiritus]KAA9007305.1 AAA family ATPase [Paenibacillus spiritus]
MNKRKIFVLMAYSGAGKTEIARELGKRGFNIVQSYTTRTPRYEGEYGHIFCTSGEYEKMKRNGDIAAYSLIEKNHYFSTKSQIEETDVYVCDPDGIKDLKEKMPEIEFITIYIKVDKSTRMRRMQQRGDDVEKILSRVVQDGVKFRNKKFDYKVPNYDFSKAVNIIEYIIRTERNEQIN